jgi:hypothetical protein
MAKRVSALSQVLKETQANITPAPEPEPENDKAAIAQNNIPALSQNDNIVKQENVNTVKPQRSTKTQERDKITYYLNPGQFDKLEEIRLAYKKATGTRLNEQELMRLIVDRLELHTLL